MLALVRESQLLRCSTRGLQGVPAAFTVLGTSPMAPSHWGLPTTCARLQTSVRGRNTQEREVEKLVWSRQAERLKLRHHSNLLQHFINRLHQHFKTGDAQSCAGLSTLWHHTAQDKRCCLGPSPHAAGRANSWWLTETYDVSGICLAQAADLSLGLTRMPSQEECKFWNGKEGSEED